MNTITEFAQEHEQILRQEQLILDATELISKIMNDYRISKADLAARLGKSKAFVTQCLCGNHNLTLRTLADFFTALGYQAHFGADPCSLSVTPIHRLYPVKNWAFEAKSCGSSMDIDLAAEADEAPEEVFCDAA